MKTRRCYIYTRVSTSMQVDGYSLDAQKDKLKKYAEFQDMVVAGEYSDEGKSGKNIEGRPQFLQMLKDIESGKDKVEFVLVFKLSRFGRNAADVLSSLQRMQDFGVNLICVEDGIDSSKDSGKLMISVLSAVAEIERENILVQTMEGRRQKAREGKWNGGFGTGKTMTQHQLAKWCDADIIIYVGCGERGNEMSQVLEEFSELIDPKSQRPMTDRTVLIANTSNMPVAAREASIYTGITLGEYYRDMGYHVAMMADSTSRWAEALREISGRLEEMPAEEGFPAYLPSRLAEFYERGGRAEVLSGGEGSVTLIGAVSPQGSDFSEPVTQNTKRFTRCFWALDKALAYSRHYPAINWMDSYSEYFNDLDPWFRENLGEDFIEYRNRISALLQEESSLMEIVKLIGSDVLPDDQKLVIETARVIRVGFLQQNAFHADDTYVPLEKQKLMMKTILHLHAKAKDIVAQNIPLSKILNLGLFDKLTKMKYDIPNSKPEMFDDYIKEIDEKLAAIS